MSMRALLVILGLTAAVSAARAAETHDLASAFKSACMGSKPFVESVADFARENGWSYRVGPSSWTGSSGETLNKEIEAWAYPPGWKPGNANGSSVLVSARTGRISQGRTLETCSAWQPGMRMNDLGQRVEAILNLPAAEPLDRNIWVAIGPEGPDETAKQWTLSADRPDYLVLDESRHLMEHTSLTRLRSLN